MRRSPGWLFGSGLAVLAIAIVGLERVSETSFTWHMVQHTLLIVVAAPLLAAGAPTVIDRLPLGAQLRVASMRGRHWAGWLLLAVFIQAAAMILWHLPSAFQAAVDTDALHGAEHITLVATAVLFWWLVFDAGPGRMALGVLALFLAALACTGLGAGLTLAAHPWYPAYRSLDDQALGGVIMWSIAGLAYFVAAIVLFFTWLSGVERSSPGRVVTSV